MSLSFDKA